MIFREIKLISDSGYEVVISENANDYVLDQDGLDLGIVGSTQNTTQYIDLIGTHLDSVVLSPRDISIIGWIIGPDEATINKRKVLLNRLINPMYNVKLEIGEYALNFNPDTSIQYSREYDYNNEWMVQFQIQGTANMPLFTLKDPNTYGQTVELEGGAHFPLTIPKNVGVLLGYYPMNSIANMPNIGDVESGFVLYLNAEGGSVVNPRITNLTTGEKLQFNYTLTEGDRIEVSTELGNQYATIISHGETYNALKYLTDDSAIDMTLALWLNNFELSADSGNDYLKAKMQFSPRFLEVEGR